MREYLAGVASWLARSQPSGSTFLHVELTHFPIQHANVNPSFVRLNNSSLYPRPTSPSLLLLNNFLSPSKTIFISLVNPNMAFIYINGYPAVGKLTVARELK